MGTLRTIIAHTLVAAVMAVSAVVGLADDPQAIPGAFYRERLDFPPTLIGQTQKRSVEVRLKPGADDTVPFIISQHPDPPYEVATRSGKRIDTVTVDRDRIEIEVEFSPVFPGEWRDSIILVRFQPEFDRIVIHLYGVGVSQSRRVRLEFGEVLTGDTVRRAALVRDPFNAPAVTWRPLGDVKAPFTILNPQNPIPIEQGSDTAGFVFTFAPVANGKFTGAMSFVRMVNGTSLDTLFCDLVGEGRRMADRTSKQAAVIEVGTMDTVDVDIALPVRPRSPYGYKLEPRSVGPIAGKIVAPTTKSLDQTIRLRFVCAPIVPGAYERVFTLLRFDGDQIKPIDSTIITITGMAQLPPRPVITVRIGFDADTMRVALGDTVRMPIILQLTSDRPQQGVYLRSVQCTATYNPTVLVPIASAEVELVDRTTVEDAAGVVFGERSTEGRRLMDGDTLLTLSFVAVVGDDDRSTVRIHALQATRDQTEPVVVRNDSVFTRRETSVLLTDVWQHQNGQRRVNTLQGTLDILVEPNPVTSEATVRVVNVPTDIGTFVIVDAMGRIVAEHSAEVRSGVTEFSIARSSGSDIVLAPGTYYARLLVRGVDGRTINSVTRLIVVR